MKLEAGKYYKTRDGRKVGPIYDDGEVWAADQMLDGMHPMWRIETGVSQFFSQEPESDYPCADLISEWPSDGPVRTVTRKEIVDGRYGVVIVSGHRVSIHGCSDHTELRAAAATLIEIADALEDGKDE